MVELLIKIGLLAFVTVWVVKLIGNFVQSIKK